MSVDTIGYEALLTRAAVENYHPSYQLAASTSPYLISSTIFSSTSAFYPSSILADYFIPISKISKTIESMQEGVQNMSSESSCFIYVSFKPAASITDPRPATSITYFKPAPSIKE